MTTHSQTMPTTTQTILVDKLIPQGPPVVMATALNNALSGNMGFECVYYEELKRRLKEIECGFLRPNKEVAVVNKVLISPAIKKAMVYNHFICMRVTIYQYIVYYILYFYMSPRVYNKNKEGECLTSLVA